MAGASSPLAPTRSSARHWYERDGGRRLALDREALAARYPGVRLVVSPTGEVIAEGTLTLVAKCGVPTRIAVRLTFPNDYPSTEPLAYDAAGRFEHVADRHFYENGRCCLWLAPESRWNADDLTGLSAFMDEVAIFFERQLAYDALPIGPDGDRPKWPWPERSHGVWGYIEWIEDELGGGLELVARLLPELAETASLGRNRPCPCGGELKYKACHRPRVEHIRNRVGRTELCGLLRPLLKELLERGSRA